MEPLYKFTAIHLDASESILFSRELAQVRARSYDIKYPDLKARSFIPVDGSMDPGAEIGIYEQYDHFGVAEFISNYAKDFPRADVKGKEFFYKVKSIGASYGYNVQEIRAAAYAKKPLSQMRANAARKAIETKLDLIARTGDTTAGLLGLFNQANTNTYTVPNGVSGTATFETKTAAEILLDLHAMWRKVVETTNDVEHPDTLLLPLSSYNLISTKLATAFSDATVLEFFLKNSPYVKRVEPWFPLETAGTAGAKLAICYKNDPEALTFVIPQEFEQFMPQTEGMELTTACHARTGGVVVTYPLTICYASGI